MAENRRKRLKADALIAKYNIKKAGIKEGETLEHAYTRLAKQADQRLVRLEQLADAQPDKYQGALKFAYGSAAADLKNIKGSIGKPRFNRAMPTDKKTLQARVNDMISFINSPSSTKGGIDKIYQKRVDTINERYGTIFTWEEWARFIETKKDDFNKNWNSKLILTQIGIMQQNPETVIADLQASADAHKNVSDAEINDAIYEKLEKNGIDASLLLDGSIPPENIPQDVRDQLEEEPEPKRRSTAKKRTQETKKTRKTAKSRKTPKSRYYGKTIAQIIRAVGRGLKTGTRRRR